MGFDDRRQLNRRRRRGYPILWMSALFALLVTACSSLSGPDTAATLGAQNGGFVAEATNLEANARAKATEIWATVLAGGTYVYSRDQINLKLLATVRANEPPTQQVIVVNPTGPVGVAGPVTLGAPDAGGDAGVPTALPGAAVETATPPAGAAADASGAQFIDTVTTNAVRASDGCPEGAQTSFATSTERIYAVTRALNIRAGTQMGVEWKQEGQVVDSKTYDVPTDSASLCIWFYIDRFTPGNWTVQFSANGQPIASALAFTVTDS